MIWIVLIVLVIASIINPKFLTIANLRTLLTGESIKGIMAFGVAFAILTRGLTCRSVHLAALIACVTGALVQPVDLATKALANFGVQVPAIVAILLGMVMGIAIGGDPGCADRIHEDAGIHRDTGRPADLPCGSEDLHDAPGIEPVRRLPLAGKRQDWPDPDHHRGIFDCLRNRSLYPGPDPFRKELICDRRK